MQYLAIALLFLCGCQSSSKEKNTQELRLNLHAEPPCLDSRNAGDTSSIAVIKMCFEGLTRIGENGKPTWGVAESAEISQDGRKAIFRLRDALWSDGHPVTAYDFETTWKTTLNPKFPSYIAENLYPLKNAKAAKEGLCSFEEIGVKALDSKTLLVEMQYPIPYLLELLSTSYFFPTPSHITALDASWAENSGSHFVGNGPFVLKKWRHYNDLVLEKSLTYWDKEAVRLQKVTLFMIDDETTELSMFQNNELDWVGSPLSSLPIDALKSLSSDPALQRHPIAGTYFYLFNTKVFPFHNVNIRKAFAFAIHRQSIIENIIQGKQLSATGLIPPALWSGLPSYFKDGDIDEARRFFALGLEELGIKAEDFPPITLSYNTVQAHHKIAQAIQQQWLEVLGVKVTLENKEWKVYLSELSKHQFQIARLGGIASFSDPVFFLDNYKNPKGAQNFCQWENAVFTKKLNEALECIDGEKRLVFLKEAEAILVEDMPLIPIYFYTGSYLKKPYVRGIYLTNLSEMDFKYAYIEK